MPLPRGSAAELRSYRNLKFYRSLSRIMRVYNKWLVERIYARGFHDFAAAFPSLLANLDTEGTRIGVLAARAGVSRQAAGQLLTQIISAGFVDSRRDPDDARATIVTFTPRGRQLLAAVLELVEEFEGGFEQIVPAPELEPTRVAMARIADALDPGGALGVGDLEGTSTASRPARPRPAAARPRATRSPARAGSRPRSPR